MKDRFSSNNTGVLIIMLLAGIVIGGFIGDYLSFTPMLSWLSYGKEFGLSSPLVIDVGVIKLQLALTLNFTIAGILGMIIAVFLYRRI